MEVDGNLTDNFAHALRDQLVGVGLASRGNEQVRAVPVLVPIAMSGRGKIDVKVGDIQISSSFDSGNRIMRSAVVHVLRDQLGQM